MTAFAPSGIIVSFTAASSAPTSAQAVSMNGCRNTLYMISNIGAVGAIIGWGVSDAIAKLNAGNVNNNCVYVPPITTVYINATPESYFTGISDSSTAVIKVQSGSAQ